jgi:hypothetical protein
MIWIHVRPPESRQFDGRRIHELSAVREQSALAGIHRQQATITSNMNRPREALHILLDESERIGSRLDRLVRFSSASTAILDSSAVIRCGVIAVATKGFRAVSWDESLVTRLSHVAMPGVRRRALAAKLVTLTNP